jgi:hypothetical protein
MGAEISQLGSAVDKGGGGWWEAASERMPTAVLGGSEGQVGFREIFLISETGEDARG